LGHYITFFGAWRVRCGFEDRLSLGGVEIGAEIADAFELVAVSGVCFGEAGSKLGGYYFQRFRIEEILEVLLLVSQRVFDGIEAVVETHFGIDSMFGGNPVDGAAYLSSVRGIAAL